jgi:hypothetical protein
MRHKAYIKNFKQRVVDALPADTDLNKVDVWFQDETRVKGIGIILSKHLILPVVCHAALS